MDSPDYLSYGKPPPAATLQAGFAESHRRTMQLFETWTRAGQEMPQLPIVNPMRWEFGHVGWFQEFWVHRHGDSALASRMPDADSLFNSSLVPHDTRWNLPLPTVPALRSYLDNIYQDTMALLDAAEPDPATAYFIQLALFHQDMHNEAFAYGWQTVGWSLPQELQAYGAAPLLPGEDWHVEAAKIAVGARRDEGFAFDNEKWSRPVNVPAFQIAPAPVTQQAYLEYVVEDPTERLPRHWRCSNGEWQQRLFDRWQPLVPDAPVCHVSAIEAEAYCRWRGRRLPTEYEWQRFAEQAGPARAFSGVWEWTASPFLPFPGFSPDPYADYSRPWFDGSYRVLKGASCWTPPRLRRIAFRNFYPPVRGDLFCGFRTCALDSR